MKISLIVAMADNRVIGLNNQMPWHLSADLKRFKKITMGAPIIMGRKTHQAIGKALPGRTNIVISTNPTYQAEGCVVFNALNNALTYACQSAGEVFVIGGAVLYQALLPQADKLYLTKIHKNFSGDTFFPEIAETDWQELERQDINDDPDTAFSYSFINLVRRS